MIKRKLALLGTAVAVSLLMTVPAFAADTKDTDTAQNAQNIQSVQEEKTEENTGYVTCSVLNVRRANSEKSDKVGTLKRGEEVKILRDEENGWYAIDFEGHIRYVHGDYITTDQDEAKGYTASSWDGPVLTASAGTITGPSGKETYYNLNMSGVVSIMRSLGNTDEYWVRDDGVKMLGNIVPHTSDVRVLRGERGIMLLLPVDLRGEKVVFRLERTALRHAAHGKIQKRVRRDADQHCGNDICHPRPVRGRCGLYQGQPFLHHQLFRRRQGH